MTIYDETAEKIRGMTPELFRWARTAQITSVGFVVDVSGTSQTLTANVDLGSGPVAAAMSGTFQTYLGTVTDYSTLVGTLVIVLMAPSPIVLDVIASLKLSYP